MSKDIDNLPLNIDQQVLFVTGKGGVGKTTASAALAIASRDAGMRTMLVEIDGHSSACNLISNREVTYNPTPLSKRLFGVRISSDDALREYARIRLKVKLVADRLVGNPVIHQFASAAPGFRELLLLGKIWLLAHETDRTGKPKWDRIIIDSHATGHGVGLLETAGLVARMFPVGPISSEAKKVDEFVHNHDRVGVVLVSLAEELPVDESIELRDELEQRNVNLAATIINSLLIDRFSKSEADLMETKIKTLEEDSPIRKTIENAVWEYKRCSWQSKERKKLEQELPNPFLLPFMFTPKLDFSIIKTLSMWLDDQNQDTLRSQLAGAKEGYKMAIAHHVEQR